MKTPSDTSASASKPPDLVFFLDRAIESKLVLAALRQAGVNVKAGAVIVFPGLLAGTVDPAAADCARALTAHRLATPIAPAKRPKSLP